MAEDAEETWRIFLKLTAHLPEVSFMQWAWIFVATVGLLLFVYWLERKDSNSMAVNALAQLHEIEHLKAQIDSIVSGIQVDPDSHFQGGLDIDGQTKIDSFELVKKLGVSRLDLKALSLIRERFFGDNVRIELEEFKWHQQKLNVHKKAAEEIVKKSWKKN